MDGAAIIWKSQKSIWKATRAVLKQACLCLANAGCHFKQQAT
jgi:hypothetical protein